MPEAPTPAVAQKRITLPDSVMAVIKSVTHDATINPHFRMVGVLVLLEGWGVMDPAQGEEKLPRLHLSREQWLQVCEWLTSGVPGDRIERVNLGLEFVRLGPSSFDDELLERQNERAVAIDDGARGYAL